MAHINSSFTQRIEVGAIRVDGQDGLDIVTTDGGNEVRNLRMEVAPRSWQISLPMVDLGADRSDYDSVRQLWKDTRRGLDTFDFHDFVEGDVVKVRFDSPLQITAPAGHMRHVDTLTIKEVLGE